MVIATPPKTHSRLAKRALEEGRHVFIEKPMTLGSSEAETLVKLAEEKNLTLMVGHVFLFNDGITELKRRIEGLPIYMVSRRTNFGVVRRDVDAIWNFGPHDVSILSYLAGAWPHRVLCQSIASYSGQTDAAMLILDFGGVFRGAAWMSWLDPLKVREVVVVSKKHMLRYDDVATQLWVYEKDLVPLHEISDFWQYKRQLRGDVILPHLKIREPLMVEMQHFIDCIQQGEKPLTDGRHGLEVVKILEAASQSMVRGEWISVS